MELGRIDMQAQSSECGNAGIQTLLHSLFTLGEDQINSIGHRAILNAFNLHAASPSELRPLPE